MINKLELIQSVVSHQPLIKKEYILIFYSTKKVWHTFKKISYLQLSTISSFNLYKIKDDEEFFKDKTELCGYGQIFTIYFRRCVY